MYLKKLGLITIALLWAFNLTAAEEKVLNVYNWSCLLYTSPRTRD